MASLPFYILDVFCTKKYTGNQLAVFIDPDDRVDETTMLQIAREINFAETTFVKESVQEQTFKVRIYTPECEVPFAGHPTLGTAALINQLYGKSQWPEVVLDLEVGKIPVSFQSDGLLFMTQAQPQFFETYSIAEISQLLHLEPGDLRDDLPIQEVSTGLPFIMVPLRTKAAIQKMAIHTSELIRFLKEKGRYISNSPLQQSTSLFLSSPETELPGSDFHTRMFCVEKEQLVEDAATGSANGCFLAYLLRYQQEKLDLVIEQGYEMGRYAQVFLKGHKTTPDHYHLEVGGRVAFISEGNWYF